MKLNFSLKNKEAKIEADIEGIVETSLEFKSNRPIKKSRYQIRQEEKRKNEELKQKQLLQGILIMIGILVAIILICFAGSKLFP